MKKLILLPLLALLVSFQVSAADYDIPGVPGQDYPVFTEIPQTDFDCKQVELPGYYPDIEAQCGVFHICQADGRTDSFLCPTGTLFDQQYFVCDWWFNVGCGAAHTWRSEP